MTTRAPKNRPYHHGDLRAALLAAAERLMAETGTATFGLREVARAAGVSHNAPYNHFADRRALLAAVATRAFEALRAALEAARDGAGADPVARLRAIAQAYVAFAGQAPARSRLMFGAELADHPDAALNGASAAAYEILRATIAAGVEARRLRADPAGTHALAAWALVHGLATLAIDGRTGTPDAPTLAALTGSAADTLVEGLRER